MKEIVSKVMELLAGFSMGIGPALHLTRPNPSKAFRGLDEVRWEDKWYPVEDGAKRKLLVRRGIGNGGQWTQFRNGYDQKIHCNAVITSILPNGEKLRTRCHPECEAAQTTVIAPQPGSEICKVEVSGFGFNENPFNENPGQPSS